MDFLDTPAEAAFRDEVRTWLAEHLVGEFAEIGSNHGVTVSTAIHLAAASRLPKPVRYLTLDARQVTAAVALDLDLVPFDV